MLFFAWGMLMIYRVYMHEEVIGLHSLEYTSADSINCVHYNLRIDNCCGQY